MRLCSRSMIGLTAFLCCWRGRSDGLPNLLDCGWDAEWVSFREHLVGNSKLGFPFDEDLTQQAQLLLEKHQGELMLDHEAAYGATNGMQSVFVHCNAPPSHEASQQPPFCLYGAVSAIWVVARAGHPDTRSLLGHAEFLLGSTMRFTMDFMESSAWPITLVDVLANLQRPGKFRLPADLKELAPPRVIHVHTPLVEPNVLPVAGGVEVRIVAWEIGVHASLAAEPLNMWARLMPRVNFLHRNLIRDQYPKWLPDKCETLYNHPRLTCDEVEDDITELFRRRIPQSATSKDPIESINSLATDFQNVVGARLRDVDVFMCTIAYLCLVVAELKMPTLGYFGHPPLFMVPSDVSIREEFWSRFMSMAVSPWVEFAVSDPFLQMQYQYQLGEPRMSVIRTHALYTRATHFPSRDGEVLVLDRPHECILMCLIQRMLPKEGSEAEAQSWHLIDGRLRSAGSPGYPYRFITRAMTDKKFSTFSQFRAVALWAYDMDLITFYEFYGMNTPIFMPAHLSKYVFMQDHMLYDGRWSNRRTGLYKGAQMWPEDEPTSPFNETSVDAVRWTVSFSDYFRFPEVQYFDSIPDLVHKLPRTDFFAVAQKMAHFNQDSLIETANAWRALLRRATGWGDRTLQ